MLLQVDPMTLGQNLWLIVGGVLLAGLGLIVLIIAWTGINAAIAITRQRRAYRDYIRATRRADGRSYPPFIEGRCNSCGRGDHRIYVPDSGEELCPRCYEQFWRETEKGATPLGVS